MTPKPPQIAALVIDAEDPERLAAFWSEVLGRPIESRTGPYIWLRREGGLVFGFQQNPRPSPGKDRVHIALSSADLPAAQRRVEALRGRRLTEYAEGGFLVMADPEGNAFCILPEGSVEMDDDGRAHYLE